jgi:hypothetical protein
MNSHTTIYEDPSGYAESTPYIVAFVKLAKIPMATAQLTGLGNQPVEIGMQVEMVTCPARTESYTQVYFYVSSSNLEQR